METRRHSRLQEYSNLGPLDGITFDTIGAPGSLQEDPGQALWQRILPVAQEFAAAPSGWLVLTGPSGSGKTRLAAAIANHCIKRGEPVLFVVVPDLLDHLRTAYDPQSPLSYDELFDQVRNAPLLVMDGLGAHNATPWAQEKLFQILNHRSNAELPTIFTLQTSLSGLEQVLRTRLEAPGLSQVLSLTPVDTSDAPLLQDIGGLGKDMLKQMTFENFDLTGSVRSNPHERETLRMAYEAARNFARSPQGWLFLTGGIGSGKTHLSVAIINERLGAEQPSLFAFVPAFLDHLRAAFNPDNPLRYDELFDQVKLAPFLVLDDLGSETTSRWAEEKLFQIVAYRHNTRMPTVINSSDSMEELEAAKPRIASRLKEILIVQWIPLTAPDYRDQAAKGPPREGRPRRASH